MRDDYTGMSETRKTDLQGKIGFAIGTGRCGTEFMAKVVSLEPLVSSVHERNALNETFHRYCKWYDLPVDHEGFQHAKEMEIRKDLINYPFSFESSAYLSLSVRELYDKFGAKFILLVRRPDQVVNSLIFKGWYEDSMVREDSNLALGYQECEHFHHFLGRFVPSGQKYFQWMDMTLVGKLAWYWNALNARVLEQFSGIPETHWCVVKLEELDYNNYLDIARFLGYDSTIKQVDFDALVLRRPNASNGRPRTIESWTPQEIVEFEIEVMPMAVRLGYDYQVKKLPPSKPRTPPSLLKKLCRYFVG